MPSLIPLLLVHHDLPAARAGVPEDRGRFARPRTLRARARQVASAGLRAAYDLSEAEVADLIDRSGPAASGGRAIGQPRRASPSSARAQNT